MNLEQQNFNSNTKDRLNIIQYQNEFIKQQQSIKREIDLYEKEPDLSEDYSQNNQQFNQNNDLQNYKMKSAGPQNIENPTNFKQQQTSSKENRGSVDSFYELNEEEFQFLNDKSTIQNYLCTQIDSTVVDNSQKTKILKKYAKNAGEKDTKLKDITKKFPVFYQSNRFILLWDFAVNVFIIILLFFIPISFIYEKPLESYMTSQLKIIISVVLVADLVIRCNVSYYEKGIQQKSRLKIIAHFFSIYFYSDIFPVIIYFAVGFIESSIGSLAVRLILLLFFLKISQVWRIFKNIKEAAILSKPLQTFFQLIELSVLILTISHIIASIWLYIGLKSDFYDTTWIQKREIDQASWQTQYLNSYYFTIVTMVTVGYGDIGGTNNLEMIIVILIIMASCIIFDYIITQVAQIFNTGQEFGDELKKKMDTINGYMKKRKISDYLQFNIRKYLDYYWTEQYFNNVDDEIKLIEDLNDVLKEKLLVEANKFVLKDISIFQKYFSEGFVQKMLSQIKQKTFSPDEKIFKEEDNNDCDIYFVQKGKVEICTYETHPISKKQKHVNSLYQIQKGKSFGEMSFFTGLPKQYQVRSLEFSLLLVIQRDDFTELLKEYPKDFEKFCMIRDQLVFQQDFSKFGFSCYACKKSYHLVGQCPKLHYVPNKQQTIDYYFQQNNQIRQSYNRFKKRNKFTPIKNQESVNIKFQTQFQDIIDKYIKNYLNNQNKDDENQNPYNQRVFNHQSAEIYNKPVNQDYQVNKFQSLERNIIYQPQNINEIQIDLKNLSKQNNDQMNEDYFKSKNENDQQDNILTKFNINNETHNQFQYQESLNIINNNNIQMMKDQEDKNKDNSNNQESKILTYLKQEQIEIKQAHKANSQELITESIKEYQTYFPNYNISKIIESLQQTKKKKKQLIVVSNNKIIYKIKTFSKFPATAQIDDNQIYAQNIQQQQQPYYYNNIIDQEQQQLQIQNRNVMKIINKKPS